MDKYETFARRMGAAIVDSLILVPLNVFAIILFSSFGRRAAGVGLLLSSLLTVLYFIGLHSLSGQTIGKTAMKVMVVDLSEKPISFGQSILRSLPFLIPVMFAFSFSTAGASNSDSTEFWAKTVGSVSAGFYLIDTLVCAASLKYRSIRDMMARTIVVRTDV